MKLSLVKIHSDRLSSMMLLASVVRPRQDPAIYYYANTAWGGCSEIMTGESPEVGVFPYL